MLTENKLNIYCVKLQRIKKVTLIVLAPFEVPLHVPLQVQVSLNVRARNSASLLLILLDRIHSQPQQLVTNYMSELIRN